MLLNYLELKALLKKDTSTKASKEELRALHTACNELAENLKIEKAKVQSLKERVEEVKKDSSESISFARMESFKKGFTEGSSKAVKAYLASLGFEQKKWEEEFHHLVNVRVEAFKTSKEFEDLLAQYCGIFTILSQVYEVAQVIK
ncbi:hypothetical protein L484_024919 [Morus notabilis]|uniref:Uncharacterized protein n=1 Tax=Morus notabilis TaxID=981085 RepID=W9RRS9_9ROSA|nr:hypothetical protein L484_024919 [Morus notabilis]